MQTGGGYASMDESIITQMEQSLTENGHQPGGNERYGCFAYFRTFFLYIFTDWPWETIKCISMPDNRPATTLAATSSASAQSLKPDDTIQTKRRTNDNTGEPKTASTEKSCSFLTDKLILWLVIMTLRVSVITIGLAVQLMICFRRDRISTDLTPMGPNSTRQLLRCTEKDEVICALLIPDLVIFLLAFWVYFALKFANQVCHDCFGWMELRVVIKADTAENLNELVLAITKKKLGTSITTGYIFIALFFILLSQGTSVLYLYAFQLVDKDVVIQPPLQDKDTLSGDFKSGMIAVSFVGFIALDLLYIRVIMRYAIRCQMIIYYLQMIRSNITKFQKGEERTQQNQQKSV